MILTYNGNIITAAAVVIGDVKTRVQITVTRAVLKLKRAALVSFVLCRHDRLFDVSAFTDVTFCVGLSLCSVHDVITHYNVCRCFTFSLTFS